MGKGLVTMGKGLVTMLNRKSPHKWKLAQPHNAEAQGIVVSGYTHLEHAVALLLHAKSAGPKWLRDLRAAVDITSAEGSKNPAAAIAFTCTGLQKLGLPVEALDTFSEPFRHGMYQEHRLRRLGDRINGQWSKTVIKDGPIWSGNAPGGVQTPRTVHALLLLYKPPSKDAKSPSKDLQDWAAEVKKALENDVEVVHEQTLSLVPDPQNKNIRREHFGFADGISQPLPFDADGAVLVNDKKEKAISKPDPWHGVPLGEILLGHTNAHDEKPFCAVVPEDPKSRIFLKPEGAPPGFRNLGFNGTYMVVRELRQDVAAFWNSMERAAAKMGRNAKWLAERAVGRTLDGDLLCPGGSHRPHKSGPQNSIGFMKKDRYGYGCPLGSHVRRGNPRDGLAKAQSTARTALDAANNHRILRRARIYGPPVPESERYADNGKEDRGLFFMCLNTDIVRQFEFVQQTWVMEPNFAVLFDETDPLVGPEGPFTIQRYPLRRRIDVETFVQLAGGDYFFLPSIPALNYLVQLDHQRTDEPTDEKSDQRTDQRTEQRHLSLVPVGE